MLDKDAGTPDVGGGGVAVLAVAEATPESLARLEKLKALLGEMGSVLVAFSGGVDSGFLLKVAVDTLGEKAAAITATSPTYKDSELKEAEALAALLAVRHVIVESNELQIDGFAENDEKRCYYCKSELFRIATERAGEMGLSNVVDGTNLDDAVDYRPGSVAAEELGIRSPLKEAGLTKEDIRSLGRLIGLNTWDKPNLACLSSRFPYGTRITAERLKKVGECEELLVGLGFRQFRVRYHGDVARIEVEASEVERFFDAELRGAVVDGVKRAGFTYVALDLEGYRTGSMNETLGK